MSKTTGQIQLLKHTAGPWDIVVVNHNGWTLDDHFDSQPFLPLFRIGDHDRECTKLQALADGAFMQRACNSHEDLLAACKEAERAFVGLAPNDPFFTAWQMLRAAIAKAEGKARVEPCQTVGNAFQVVSGRKVLAIGLTKLEAICAVKRYRTQLKLPITHKGHSSRLALFAVPTPHKST